MDQVKIGILTFHRCINYGSYWQAKCLADGLNQRGHDAVILDHYSRQANIAEWKCALEPVQPLTVPAADIPLYRSKIRKFFQAFETLPLSPSFCLGQDVLPGEYDVIIIGSDEVWNLHHPWYGKYPIFYGQGLEAQKLVSYAASFGNYPAAWPLDSARGELLKRFAAISVRDENSQEIIRNAINEEPAMVLDPCLQFEIAVTQETDHRLPAEFLGVYGHNFSANFIRSIKTRAAHRNLPLISIGYRNDWADQQWIDAGPNEFAQFISQASALVTNFFHGCVFALRYSRPFVCETSPYRENKLRGLMNKVGANKHLVTAASPPNIYTDCLENPPERQVQEKIKALQQTSNDFIEHALTLSPVMV